MADEKTAFEQDVTFLRSCFKDCGDIVIHTFKTSGRMACVAYFDDLVDRSVVEKSVLHGLMVDIELNGAPAQTALQLINNALITADYKLLANVKDGVDEVLCGNTLLLVEGFDGSVSVSAKKVPGRGVNKPDTEAAVQGPQDAFCESLRTNTVLIRRRIRDTALKCIQLQAGKRTRTDIALMYIEGVADENVVAEAKKRLDNITADGILDSGYIEQYIRDDKYALFPQVQLTERPDKTAAGLLEGRVAVVVDNTPFVVLIPVVLASFYQAAEDYYQQWQIASFVRLIRFVAGFAAFALPGLYVAAALYSPSVLPLDLMLHMAGARAGVPVSTMAEVIGMELAFEALREAGIRLPAAVGGTLGIVGGIIIGQAAVDAGLVSPMVVIVVAFTGICSFTIPTQSLVSAYRLIKYFIIAASAFFGFYGFVLALLCVTCHTAGIESFGMPYIYPFGSKSGLKRRFRDSLLRLPLGMQSTGRPIFGERMDEK